VEKCKFLQESKCKGMCLHLCKVPAQEFFTKMLGMELMVSQNFAMQECQWLSRERPVPIALGPFAQARDTAQQEEEEERADHNLRKVTFERRKKGLHSSSKMDFYEMLTKPRMKVV
jgi:hypothetical protein